MSMNIIDWNDLDEIERDALLARPRTESSAQLASQVRELIARVRREGELALLELTRQFDRCELSSLWVSQEEFETAETGLTTALKGAIDAAYARILRFHEAGMVRPYALETAPGVRCERVLRPIARVGLYVPAGSAPLPSTALMLGIPAQLAGCRDVVMCSPPRADGCIDSAVLYAARRSGIRRVCKLGGAQAIAAMAYGTGSIPKCDKVFGPGNAWVTQAKLQVATDPRGAAIDLPAGPSEVLVIADAGADPEFVAADLLSQAEHGPDSQVLLVSDSPALVAAAICELAAQLESLPRRDIARQALQRSRAILCRDISQAMDISNRYAPEHLILAVREARTWLPSVESAGSVFLGDFAPEALGDYCSGTNHVLPTNGAARGWSGVSVASFQKQITVQEVNSTGLLVIGPHAVELAQAECLAAHAAAVTGRRDRILGVVA